MTDGAMGAVPRWYRLMQAARYLNVDIREMDDMPWRYVLQAEAATDAEAYAATEHRRRAALTQ